MGGRGSSSGGVIEKSFAARARDLFKNTDTLAGYRDVLMGSKKAETDKLANDIADYYENKAKKYGFKVERTGEGVTTRLMAEKTQNGKTVFVNPTLNNGGVGNFAIGVEDPSYRKPGVRFQVSGRSRYFNNFDTAFRYANKILNENKE